MGQAKDLLHFVKKTAPLKEVCFRIAELCFGYPLYCLSFLFPRQQSKWVFGTNVGFIDNAKYLYLYVLNNRKEKIYWISDKKDVIKKMQQLHLPSFYKWSLKGIWHCLTASVYIFTYHSKDINFFTSGNAKKVNLWHGVGIKSSGLGSNNKSENNALNSFLMNLAAPYNHEKFNLFLSTSPLMNNHFMKMFSLNENVIFEGLYPRCSFLQLPIQEIETIIRQSSTKEEKDFIAKIKTFSKVYLYMPTWRSDLNDSFIQKAGFDFQKLNSLMKNHKSLFIFKLHPAIRFYSNVDEFDSICFMDPKMDVYPILPFTDILITDYSSIYYDYLLMSKKEALLFPFDEEEYQKTSKQLAFDYQQYTPGTRVYSFEELLQAIEQNIDLTISNREQILQLFWNDYHHKSIDQLYEKIKSLSV